MVSTHVPCRRPRGPFRRLYGPWVFRSLRRVVLIDVFFSTFDLLKIKLRGKSALCLHKLANLGDTKAAGQILLRKDV